MIFLVLHEEGAIFYQEKRDAARSSSTPIPSANRVPVGQPNAKRKLEGLSGGSPVKRSHE
jgi:hypothetical protein